MRSLWKDHLCRHSDEFCLKTANPPLYNKRMCCVRTGPKIAILIVDVYCY